MRFLLALFDALVSFVQRNPLTVLIVLILALGAPAVLKGIAMFVLYVILGLVVVSVVLMFVFRWKINAMRRQMEEQFGEPHPGGPSSDSGPQSGREGDVKIYKTTETPQKRVSKSVGDYVDFEEEKN